MCTIIKESDGSTYFTYNYANLVTSIKYKSGVSNYFYYDSMLRRYAWEDSDGLCYFSWDYSGTNLLSEKDTAGDVTAYYSHGYSNIRGIGSLIAAKKGNVDQFPAMDHRGSIFRLTNGIGDVQAYYEYNSYGEPLQQENNSGATNRFTYQSNWIELKDSGGNILLSPSRLYCYYIGN